MISLELSQSPIWPELPYDKFRSTAYLLHRLTQAMGKFKLATPFEPHWANVALWVTGEGVTTGPIPYQSGSFSIELDLLNHQVICISNWGKSAKFLLHSMSVAKLIETLFATLRSIDIEPKINLLPQEIPNPIPCDQDKEERLYDHELASNWLQILTNTFNVLQRYHAKFTGISPSVGFMWGTFDLRDARYQNIKIPTTGLNAGYIRRNAMDVAQVEAGWWCGNDQYPKGAFYSFMYPSPAGLEKAKIEPNMARWDATLGEFILDYDDLRRSKQPEKDLLQFFESAYAAGAKLAEWSPDLIAKGEPV